MQHRPLENLITAQLLKDLLTDYMKQVLENMTSAQMFKNLLTDYMHQALLENLTTTQMFKNLLLAAETPGEFDNFLPAH
jgi:hypothetical protein